MLFQLHPRLEQDCITVGHFELCRLLMMNDNRYPWFILVPEVADIREIYQLNSAQKQLLMNESCYLAEQLVSIYQADKLNIAAIGNSVPQLHVHHVVRYRTDCAWPSPVWGKFDPIPLSDEQICTQMARLHRQINFKVGA